MRPKKARQTTLIFRQPESTILSDDFTDYSEDRIGA
jgi:hypothetical protein